MKVYDKNITGWGNFPKHKTKYVSPNCIDDLLEIQKNGTLIARGNGRSYGDCSYSPELTVDMKNFNKIINFDQDRGVIECQSGVLLSDIIDKYMPLGWFPAVSPGTKFVTIGGMVASDVHGKNHHKDGSFSNFINWFEILSSSNDVIRCSREKNTELFHWTIGGMGLTGIILNVSFSLKKIKTSWMNVNNIANRNLKETFESIEKNNGSTYSVAWIDSTSSGPSIGKSILMIAEHASPSCLNEKRESFEVIKKRRITMPFYLPNFFLRRYIIKMFNFCYYNFQKAKRTHLLSWDDYFYPLDNINDWNKIYGRNGFFQIQCVFPIENSKAGIEEILIQSSKAKHSSFLTVLKMFKDQKSNISFPMHGYTITLDFPVNKHTKLLVPILEKIVLKYNGRFYLTKDSIISRESFLKSDIRLNEFRNYRLKMNLSDTYRSYQSMRLDI